MVDLVYDHPAGHFERHLGRAVVLKSNGEIAVRDEAGKETTWLEWSAVEAMISSRLSGAEAHNVEVSAHGDDSLEVRTDTGKVLWEKPFFALYPDQGGLQLRFDSKKTSPVLRSDGWWLNGAAVGDLIVSLAAEELALDFKQPGSLSRPSALAERTSLQATPRRGRATAAPT